MGGGRQTPMEMLRHMQLLLYSPISGDPEKSFRVRNEAATAVGGHIDAIERENIALRAEVAWLRQLRDAVRLYLDADDRESVDLDRAYDAMVEVFAVCEGEA